ncbi:MAG: hypothetical protein GC152_10695 [Alphaproteobacteria bacterium]|nr:hypothetical protein [Alphaproteobacteria bacterium]
MAAWFRFWRERASWLLFVAAVVAQSAFSLVFLNGEGSAWEKALAAGGGRLPEEQPGLVAIEPQRSIDAIQANSGVADYVLWQLIDIPYAVLNVIVITAAIALLLRKAGLQGSILRLALWLPLAYFAAECVENAMVAAFALDALAPNGTPAIVQQAATTIKLATGFGGMGLGLAAVVGAAIADIVRRIRR